MRPHFPILLGLGPDIEPRAAVGDKGYASKARRQAARKRSVIPAIPHKANEKQKLKRFKGVVLRCEKTKRNFASIAALTAGFILVQSVRMA